MAEITLDKPDKATSYPSPLIDPKLKDKKYDLECAKAIYWHNWNYGNNAYGNSYRAGWLDNRAWARGTQSNDAFSTRPPAKNDHTKNPLLKHIDFATVNEMVKYCDIYTSILEENDLDITATAINPAAALSKRDMKNAAQAYMDNKGFAEQISQVAGIDLAPKNPMPYEFETKQELDIFFDIGVKLKEEIEAELASEVVMNDSDWPKIRKLVCEDTRDTGYMIVKRVFDSNNRIRYQYVDVPNSGWDDFRGHYLETPARFWTIVVKTGAQLAAETDGQLTKEEMLTIAKMANGKYGNPMLNWLNGNNTNQGYVNSDSAYRTNFYDSWKFPVMECVWEDWDVTKYRSRIDVETKTTETYAPVNYDYKPKQEKYKERKTGKEKRINVDSNRLHYYRECKWIIGTESCYDAGPVKYCPRNPRDERYALSPVIIYRTAGNPFTNRLKPIAKMAQNAWYKFQNEVAKAKPSSAAINLKAMDNLTSIDGMKLTRRHILELYNEDGTILYSDKASLDANGQTRTNGPPIMPIANVDIAAMQRWVDVINFCSQRMSQESGLNEFVNGGTPPAYTPAPAAKAAVAASANAFKQYVDGLLKIGEEMAIGAIGTLQLLVQEGDYEGYVSSMGMETLKPVSISKGMSLFKFGIKVQAKPTAQQREELKMALRQQFGNIADPTQGSLYAPDLIRLEQMIDNGTNLKIVALIAAYYHKRNMAQIQQSKIQDIQANTESQKQIAKASTDAKVQLMQQEAQIDIAVNKAKTDDAIRFEQAKSQLHTDGKLVVDGAKAQHKTNEKILDKTLEV